MFPSPTGVNYYEWQEFSLEGHWSNSFRPQQGLTIMNPIKRAKRWIEEEESFRPQQGLTIMNYLDSLNEFDLLVSFRPQQGLTIMNKKQVIYDESGNEVSVPNRG